MVGTLFDSSLSAGRRYANSRSVRAFELLMSKQYGNVFTFIMFGRRMTISLDPCGAHFVAAAQSNAMSASKAQVVCRFVLRSAKNNPHDKSDRI